MFDPSNPMSAMMAEAMADAFGEVIRRELEPLVAELKSLREDADKIAASIDAVKAKGGMLAKMLGA